MNKQEKLLDWFEKGSGTLQISLSRLPSNGVLMVNFKVKLPRSESVAGGVSYSSYAENPQIFHEHFISRLKARVEEADI